MFNKVLLIAVIVAAASADFTSSYDDVDALFAPMPGDDTPVTEFEEAVAEAPITVALKSVGITLETTEEKKIVKGIKKNGSHSFTIPDNFVSTKWYAHKLTRGFLRIDTKGKFICWPIGCVRAKCARNTGVNRSTAKASYKRVQKIKGCHMVERKVKIDDHKKAVAKAKELKTKEIAMKRKERADKAAKKREKAAKDIKEKNDKEKTKKEVAKEKVKKYRAAKEKAAKEKAVKDEKKDKELKSKEQATKKKEAADKQAERERSSKADEKRSKELSQKEVSKREKETKERSSKASEKKSKAALSCVTTTASSNNAGIVIANSHHGYVMVGGGMVNHYRNWNAKGAFEEAMPQGNTFRCDTGFGPGRLSCYNKQCKTNVGGLHCTTKSKRFTGSGVIDVHLPSGYVMTGGGLYNHYRHFNAKAGFEETRPNGNAWRGDMGFGWGDYTVYVRGCKAPAGHKLNCLTKVSGRGNYNRVYCPSGYQATGCGVLNHYRHWNAKSAYESHFPVSNNECDCDTAFGGGDNQCYVRCCKLN